MSKHALPYSTIPLEDGCIRLLRILPPIGNETIIACELITAKIHTSTYKALSYVWGSPTDCNTIVLNDCLWQVTQNLFRFLEKASTTFAGQNIWIDALCINQSDVEERNQQVRMMGDIYTQATEVLVWLDEAVDDIEILQGLPTLHQRQGMPSEPSQQSLNAAIQWHRVMSSGRAKEILSMIASHAYWRRMWIVQEFSLAEHISFVFQRGVISLSQLNDIHRKGLASDALEHREFGRLSGLLWFRQEMTRIRGNKSSTKPTVGIDDLIHRFGSRACTDLRDRVFALIGMSNNTAGFVVDYRMNTCQIFVSLMVHTPLDTLSSLMDLFFLRRTFQVLQITSDDIIKHANDLPVHTLSHPLLGLEEKIELIGSENQLLDSRYCRCSSCNLLGECLSIGVEVYRLTFKESGLRLVYTRVPNPLEVDDSHLCDFMGCETWVEASGRWCWFVPQSGIPSLLRGSRLALPRDLHPPYPDDDALLTMCQKSLLAYARCRTADAQEIESELALSHSDLTMLETDLTSSDRDRRSDECLVHQLELRQALHDNESFMIAYGDPAMCPLADCVEWKHDFEIADQLMDEKCMTMPVAVFRRMIWLSRMTVPGRDPG